MTPDVSVRVLVEEINTSNLFERKGDREEVKHSK